MAAITVAMNAIRNSHLYLINLNINKGELA
jgi:hypothetical protein